MKEKELKQGFVTAVHRERYEVNISRENGEAEIVYAKLKSGIYFAEKSQQEFPMVGDNVILEYNSLGDSLIIETLKRKTRFSRKDPDVGRGEQTVAANFDYVFIMMSLNHDFNLKRLERYLTVTWQSGAAPVVVLTKSDLATDLEEKLKLAGEAALNAEVIAISSVTGEGVEQLQKYLQPGRTICFLGSSGVGKSTFTNLLLGEDKMLTNTIRENDSKGHHTTTHRQMFLLQNGARIIDTPGMRELGMWIVEDGMEASFGDIEEIICSCRFRSCTHTKEPGCAVKIALEKGTLTKERWSNYLKIAEESKQQAERAKKKNVGKSKKREIYNRKDGKVLREDLY